MYQTRRTYITANSKMLDVIYENHTILLFLQHFNINFTVGNMSVRDLCKENHTNENAFITIANLYNGFFPKDNDIQNIKDIKSVLYFLKNSHKFYLNDKYPELEFHLKKIKNTHNSKDFILLEQFFNEYFAEVVEHLKYEDEIVFPYFSNLITGNDTVQKAFSVDEYRNHHTDIETKLTDLKNLFLKHLKINNELGHQRKFLNTLFELEFDLKIHATIEDKILIPLVERIEKESYA